MHQITTVIPVYNGEKYIAATLDSLARQTRRPDRVVVVDDCSKDRTREIVENFQGLKCDWAPNAQNLGLFGNHNSALRFASETRFLHILHSNDLIAPTFFEKLVPLIERAPGYALSYGGHEFLLEDGSATGRRSSIGTNGPRQLSAKEFLASQTELKSLQLHSAVMKTDYKPCPVQFRTDLPQLGDVVFHAQFAAFCSQIWAHPDILAQVRIHTDSATSKNIRNLNAWVLDEWKTMQLVYGIMREKGLGSFARSEKIKLLFAARAHVKIKSIRRSDPEYASTIRAASKPLSGALEWIIARCVVAARDALFPPPDTTGERLAKNAQKQ